MLLDLEKAYDYLQSNNIIETFITNYQSADNQFKSMQTDKYRSFIRRAFRWSPTSEGQQFWDMHDENILLLSIHLSATDVYNYIKSQQQTPEPYEYW